MSKTPIRQKSSGPLGAMGRMALASVRRLGVLIPSSWVKSVMDQHSSAGFERLARWGYPLERPVLRQQRALHYAVYGRDTRLLRAVIEAGADINAPGDGGASALRQGVWQNRMDVVEALLAAGARIDEPEESGEALLTRAMISCPDAVEPLLRAGADPLSAGDPRGPRGGLRLPLELALYFAESGRSSERAERQLPLLGAAIERLELEGVKASSSRSSRGRRL